MKTDTITATGKSISLTPHSDALFLNEDAPKLSVEYAKARNAINADFRILVKGNVAMAKRIRRESKRAVTEFLKGKVSKKQDVIRDKDNNPVLDSEGKEQPETKFLVTFPDNSVARL